MLVDIFVTVPSLLMTTIAWYIHVGLVLTCLIVLFAVVIGAVALRCGRAEAPAPYTAWRRTKPFLACVGD
jgi:hypothetical protein